MPRTIIFFIYSFPRIWYSIHFHLQKKIIILYIYFFVCGIFQRNHPQFIHRCSLIPSFHLRLSHLPSFPFHSFLSFYHKHVRNMMMTIISVDFSWIPRVFLFLRTLPRMLKYLALMKKLSMNINWSFCYIKDLLLVANNSCEYFFFLFLFLMRKKIFFNNNKKYFFWKQLYSLPIIGQVR